MCLWVHASFTVYDFVSTIIMFVPNMLAGDLGWPSCLVLNKKYSGGGKINIIQTKMHRRTNMIIIFVGVHIYCSLHAVAGKNILLVSWIPFGMLQWMEFKLFYNEFLFCKENIIIKD